MANTNPRKRVAVYIGRFQPLHNGHVHVLNNAFQNYDGVVVLVGSANKSRDIKNPFTYIERRQIITNWVLGNLQVTAETSYEIRPLPDQPYNDAKWIQSVQENVQAAVRDFGFDNPEIFVTGSERDDSTWYLRCFPQWGKDFKDPHPVGEDLNATALRDRLFTGAYMTWRDIPEATDRFLRNFITTPTLGVLRDEYNFIKAYKERWAFAPYAPTFVTADSVIIQSGHILVVERGALPGKGLWALPGGFVKPKQRVKEAAITEVLEETGLRLAEGKRAKEITEDILRGSIVDYEYFDDPNRSLRGRTITFAFLYRLDDTKPLPKVAGQFAPLEDTGGVEGIVETAKAFWLPISEARANPQNWFEDHHAIIDTMVGLIKD
jgi:bifunctional NMN adenylyltransferase/nudix hydrolase